ncbi:MAG: hypothetical protein NTY09_08405 [bacterium]|nr:hypothetical protein [bacterium]
MGPGMGMGPGPDMGPGMGMGPGMDRGPQAMLGMEFLMQDENIKLIMNEIRLVEGINRLKLTADQVQALKGLATEAQGVVDAQCGDTRDRIHQALEDQLNSVIAGEEINRDEFRAIMEETRGQVDPGAIKEQLQGVLDRAFALLDEDQKQMLMSDWGDGGEGGRPFMDRMRERMQDRHGMMGPDSQNQQDMMNPDNQNPPENMGPDQNQQNMMGPGPDQQDMFSPDRPGMEWLNMLDDETRAGVEEQIRAHMGDMQQDAAKMKLMMMLLSPDAVEAMDAWLAAH